MEPLEPVHPQEELILEPQIQPQWPFRRNIIMLNGSLVFPKVKNRKLMPFKASLYDINQAMDTTDHKELPLEEMVPNQGHEFLPYILRCLTSPTSPRYSPLGTAEPGGVTNLGTPLFDVKSRISSP